MHRSSIYTVMRPAIAVRPRRRELTGQIVENFFQHQFFQTSRKVPSSNPPIKDRVNCVNAMLRNQAGECRLHIDPRCKQLIQDLERVHWKCDVNGNTLTDIDKSDPARSHVSDALGYMIATEFGMRGKFGEMPFSPR
jgi:hypothetical protein